MSKLVLVPELSGQASPEQIEAWKKSHPGGIFAMKVDGNRMIYFKKPSWIEANCIAANTDPEAPLQYLKDAAHMLCIGGDREVLEKDDLLIGLVIKLREQINGAEAEVVNL
jgi:hypothetical protein